jgi:hypothetical protein
MTKNPPVLRFDPQRRAADDELRAVIAALSGHLEMEERRLHLRSRERRDKDRRNFRNATEALACNLLIAAITSTKATLGVPRGHGVIWGKGRYRDPIYGQHFLGLIDLLCELGFTEKVTHGYRFSKNDKQPTTIRPTRAFKKRMRLNNWKMDAFRQEDAPEILILKPTKDHDGRAEPIDYNDTKRTAQWRREIARLNEWLRDAPINILSHEPAASIILDNGGQPTEPYRRSLRRIFNNADWQQGGRLFGGFWMTMERSTRFQLLRIMDEPVVNVDFGSLFPRLAYVRANEAQPEGDLYDITGDGSCRDGWKQLINALLFAERPLKQWPRDTREKLPKNISFQGAITAIKAKHAPIAHLFESGLGFYLMRIESDMLITVVTALFKQGITALPLHDSVLVARSHGDATKEVMETAFGQHTGSVRATVKIDSGPNL